MTTSKKHKDAQQHIASLLTAYYQFVKIEHYMPTPNEKFLYDKNEYAVKPYKLDVYADTPFVKSLCRYQTIGIELDGDVGHKKTKHQYDRDNARTSALIANNSGLYIHRFDSDDLIGKGHLNKKTRQRTPIFTDKEIRGFLGLKEVKFRKTATMREGEIVLTNKRE